MKHLAQFSSPRLSIAQINQTLNKTLLKTKIHFQFWSKTTFVPIRNKVIRNVSLFREFASRFPPKEWVVRSANLRMIQHFTEMHNAGKLNLLRIASTYVQDDLLFYNFVSSLLLSKTNSSIIKNPGEITIAINFNGKIGITWYYHPNIRFNVLAGSFLHRPAYVLIETEGFTFFTCYSKSYLTFKYYLQSFQASLWIALTIHLVILGILAKILINLESKKCQ